MTPINPEAFVSALGDQLRDQIVTASRLDNGRRLSVRQVAIHIGMQPNQLGRYLNGDREMPVSLVPRVLNAIEALAGVPAQTKPVICRAEQRAEGKLSA